MPFSLDLLYKYSIVSMHSKRLVTQTDTLTLVFGTIY